jgi:hypothetical protein
MLNIPVNVVGVPVLPEAYGADDELFPAAPAPILTVILPLTNAVPE